MLGRGSLFCVVLALGGCTKRFDGHIYRGEGFAFAVQPLPERWQRIKQPDAALAFRDADSGGSILVTARCGMNEDDVPLGALTQHLFIDFTKREIEEQTVVPFDGREAMHTMMTADFDGVAMRYDAWVMKKDGCVYDILYFAPPARFERGRPAFDELVRGFTTAVPSE